MSTKSSADRCVKCKASVQINVRHCPSCGRDMGCPNVRAANASDETAALDDRYKIALDKARKQGNESVFLELAEVIRTKSHVVVSMSPKVARQLVEDPRSLYASYEDLVGSNSRTPAIFENDTQRAAIGGKLFGSYANEIRYGVLSVNGTGLPNYGIVFIKLSDVAVEDRVSFLDENSYFFLARHPIDQKLPAGYRASWDNRGKLAVTKIGITADLTIGLDMILVKGETRADDKCVEAHIYGSFNLESIEAISFAHSGENRTERLEVEIVGERFAAYLASKAQRVEE